jgi:two-component system C4-dicarboxylate transport sensor histidine kinase DctB
MKLPTLPFAPRVASRRRLAVIVVLGVLLVLLVALGAQRWAASRAMSKADLAARQMASTQAGLLASELQKFRLLPIVLAEYPDVRTVLQHDDPEVARRLNGKLELFASRTDAAAIYAIDPSGRTLAASNWRLPTSFVGQNYAFRPYFRGAMANGSAELFALGTVSGRPGLFIARRVEENGKDLGVIVVKVEFDAVEAQWARQEAPTMVTDAHGVVLITSRPEWRFHTIRPLDAETVASIRQTVQFGGLPLSQLSLRRAGGVVTDRAAANSPRFREAVVPVPMVGSRLHFLQPLEAAEASANASARTIVLIALIVVSVALAWLIRSAERRRMQVESRRALEKEVQARTSELSEANRRLTEESHERERSDRRYRLAREELAQANRLSAIGQIIAGVIHEINQPVAAIRSFADNASSFLDRKQPGKAKQNLGTIAELTARIGAITAELRTFARRGTPAIGALRIGDVFDGALLLLGDRIRAGGVTIDRRGDDDIEVRADRIRLEQILINLIQNALDALEATPDPVVRIEAEGGSPVTILVADNGPGIDPAVADDLFTPFVTGREEGLGLGLGIARDIAREFGGELELANSPLGGAAFELRLERA